MNSIRKPSGAPQPNKCPLLCQSFRIVFGSALNAPNTHKYFQRYYKQLKVCLQLHRIFRIVSRSAPNAPKLWKCFWRFYKQLTKMSAIVPKVQKFGRAPNAPKFWKCFEIDSNVLIVSDTAIPPSHGIYVYVQDVVICRVHSVQPNSV